MSKICPDCKVNPEAPPAMSIDERAAVTRCVEWLKARAAEIEGQIDDECDGCDADNFCAEATTIRDAARDMAIAFGAEWKQ